MPASTKSGANACSFHSRGQVHALCCFQPLVEANGLWGELVHALCCFQAGSGKSMRFNQGPEPMPGNNVMHEPALPRGLQPVISALADICIHRDYFKIAASITFFFGPEHWLLLSFFCYAHLINHRSKEEEEIDSWNLTLQLSHVFVLLFMDSNAWSTPHKWSHLYI